MLFKSPCNAVSREVVHNGHPAFLITCTEGKTPKWKGRGSSRLPSILPTGISQKDWVCLNTREISSLLIRRSPGGTNQLTGPSSPCWQASIKDFIPTFISFVKLYSCLCYRKKAGLNKMYPVLLPNHLRVTQEHKDTPLESIFFVNLVHFAAFWASLAKHHLNGASEGGSGVRLKGLKEPLNYLWMQRDV